ncbi:RHS repeat protein [Pseudomonas syringae UB303]|uniref:RHS repeat protein n=2 Tax=Pseudomonas syringae TaxID=317 RepID=A0AAJ4B5C3_PSESX|nr:RHS repeat protein [Pseudomonas syringae UB303]
MQLPTAWLCTFKRKLDGQLDYVGVERKGSNCPIGRFSNDTLGVCNNDEQKGAPPPDSCVGNPINAAVGNKFQLEVDYQFKVGGGSVFSRSYNSFDGLWRHNYSAYLRFATGQLSLVHADGRESFYTISGGTVRADPTETGILVKSGDNWLYTSKDNHQYLFDAEGRLAEWKDVEGFTKKLTYENRNITVSSAGVYLFTFTEDAQHQPLSFTAPDTQIAYYYDSNNHLTQLTRTRGLQTERRKFSYEDTRNTGLLTGITDERGIQFATWAYDEKGRAISSQHSGGAGLTQVAYNADGSSTVTNELGKTTVYQYQQIGGIKRVTSIKGEPSANCPGSNSSYTYNDRGLVLTKTDAKGLITTYEYNDRGLEISRTEASGTTLARTTITEWDPDLFLPIRVIEPNRVTVYSYDNQGRELTRQSTSR